MADAMDRVRAAEERYNAVIERTAKLDTRLTTLQTSLQSLERETETTLGVLGKLRRELEREEDAAQRRSAQIRDSHRIPLQMHRWFLPVAVTALFFGLFGDFVRDFGVRLRELLGG